MLVLPALIESPYINITKDIRQYSFWAEYQVHVVRFSIVKV
jgi:hypothetical protein